MPRNWVSVSSRDTAQVTIGSFQRPAAVSVWLAALFERLRDQRLGLVLDPSEVLDTEKAQSVTSCGSPKAGLQMYPRRTEGPGYGKGKRAQTTTQIETRAHCRRCGANPQNSSVFPPFGVFSMHSVDKLCPTASAELQPTHMESNAATDNATPVMYVPSAPMKRSGCGRSSVGESKMPAATA